MSANKKEKKETKKGDKNEVAALSTSPGNDGDLQARRKLISQAHQLKMAISDVELFLQHLQTRKWELSQLWNSEKGKLVEKGRRFEFAAAEASILEFDRAEKIEKLKRQTREALQENQQAVAAEKVELDASLNSTRLERINAIAQCKSGINFIKYIEREKESCYCELLRNLSEHYSCRVRHLQTAFQQKRLENIERSNQEIEVMQEEMEEKFKNEIHFIEQEKDAEVELLLINNQEELNELTVYYKNIAKSNFDLLKTLQEQEVEAQQEKREESLISSKVKKEHAKRAEPMESYKSDATRLSNHLVNNVEERLFLLMAKPQLSDLNHRFEDLKWQHELLLQSLLLSQKECDAYKAKFLSSIYQSQQQNELHNLLLEKTLLGLLERGEQQTATLSNVLMRGNFDPGSVQKIQSQITNVLQLKADQIFDLETELIKARQVKENIDKVMQVAQL